MPRPALRRPRRNSFQSPKSNRRPSIRVPDPAQTWQALEKKLAGKPIGKPDSDDSDDIVTTRSVASARGRKRQEIFASGAVAKGDKPGGYPTRAQRTRTMRENTDEILSQRSRSVSRANSVASAKSSPVPPSPHVEAGAKTKESGTTTTKASKKRKIAEAKPHANGVSQVPQTEMSVLGKIKPRKRQDSILRLIENDHHNSSIADTDDEMEFLPDEVSTPLTNGHKGTPLPTNSITASLKRKRGSDVNNSALDARSSSIADQRSRPELPQPTRTQRRKLSSSVSRPAEVDDVMALPESSDSEESSNEQGQQILRDVDVKKRPAIVPSTEQLQNLMPSKKHKPVRQRQARGEFELPERSVNSSEDEVEDENEHSTFLPAKSRKAQRRSPLKTRKVAVTPQKSLGNGAKRKTNIKDKSKSTSNAFTPPSVRVRTPLPLSSVQIGRTQAKSPSKQDTALRDKSVNTPLPKRSIGDAKKRYGGFRDRKHGKENQPLSLSDGQSRDEEAISPQMSKVERLHSNAPEIQAWNKKWADIDDFDLQFEEVTASTRSNSPMAR